MEAKRRARKRQGQPQQIQWKEKYPKSMWSALTQDNKLAVKRKTVKWLQSHYQPCVGSSIEKQQVYDDYKQFCAEEAMVVFPVDNVFGKYVAETFPSISIQRLGKRGQNRYHYCGLQSSSRLNDDVNFQMDNLYNNNRMENISELILPSPKHPYSLDEIQDLSVFLDEEEQREEMNRLTKFSLPMTDESPVVIIEKDTTENTRNSEEDRTVAIQEYTQFDQESGIENQLVNNEFMTENARIREGEYTQVDKELRIDKQLIQEDSVTEDENKCQDRDRTDSTTSADDHVNTKDIDINSSQPKDGNTHQSTESAEGDIDCVPEQNSETINSQHEEPLQNICANTESESSRREGNEKKHTRRRGRPKKQRHHRRDRIQNRQQSVNSNVSTGDKDNRGAIEIRNGQEINETKCDSKTERCQEQMCEEQTCESESGNAQHKSLQCKSMAERCEAQICECEIGKCESTCEKCEARQSSVHKNCDGKGLEQDATKSALELTEPDCDNSDSTILNHQACSLSQSTVTSADNPESLDPISQTQSPESNCNIAVAQTVKCDSPVENDSNPVSMDTEDKSNDISTNVIPNCEELGPIENEQKDSRYSKRKNRAGQKNNSSRKHSSSDSSDDKESWNKLTVEEKETYRKWTMEWARREFEENPQVCLPHGSVFTHYEKSCLEASIPVMFKTLFGRVLQQEFKNLSKRRLGCRNSLQYYYVGLDIREESHACSIFQQQRLPNKGGQRKVNRVY